MVPPLTASMLSSTFTFYLLERFLARIVALHQVAELADPGRIRRQMDPGPIPGNRAGRRLFSQRRSSIANASNGRFHRPAPGRVRGRADLPAAAVRPVGVLRTQGPDGGSGPAPAARATGLVRARRDPPRVVGESRRRRLLRQRPGRNHQLRHVQGRSYSSSRPLENPGIRRTGHPGISCPGLTFSG